MAKSNKGRKFFATTATAALVASAIVPVASAAQINDFNSISSYAQEAVQDLNDRGVIKGDQKGNFNPKSAITRAEAATILAGALELEGSGSTSFTDVKKSAWYYDAIDAAVANGIFQGQGAGKFNPSANLTRSEAAIILVDAFGLEGSADLSTFKDSASVKSWAEEALSIAVENGVMKGDDNGNLKPNASITRQDFALMYYRTEGVEGTEEVSGSVKAINNTTVEVTFTEEVEDIEALDFTIEGLEVKNAVVKQTNSKVVVLTTSAQTADVDYKVAVNGEAVGSFKGIGAVIPTSIKVETTSVQSKVGAQVTLKATTTPGAQVTFNVQATGNSLNENKKVEVTAGTDGVATYSYTQYGVAGVDNVTVYPTGAPSLLGYAKVYWGADYILSVDSESKTVDNGGNRTYKVTYKDPTTGQPVQNKKLKVTFKENLNDIDGSKTNDTTASARKDSGQYVTPYQDSTATAGTNREQEFEIITNSVGEATFVVTGNNTTATPVIFEDGNNNGRFEATELQVTAGETKFQGVQSPYEIKFTSPTADRVAALSYEHGQSNPVAYKIKVNTDKKDKDGNPIPYVGATVKVAIQQNQDATLSNNTPALIANSKNGTYTNTGVVSVVTDSKGEATVYLKSAVDNSKATPVAWIDLNAAGQVGFVGNDKLEDGEPVGVAPTVTFLKSVVVAPDYALNKPTEGPFVNGDKMVWTASLLNQSGNVSETAGIKNATFTIKNDSNAIQTINPKLVDENGRDYKELTVTYAGSTLTQNFTNGNSIVLEPGTTVTIHGTANGYVATSNTVNEYSTTNDAKLEVVAPAKDGKLTVSSNVTTVRKTVTQDVRNNNNTYNYDAATAEFIVSTLVGAETVTGEVIGYEVADNKFGTPSNFGRVVIKEALTGKIKHYYYKASDAYSAVFNKDFNNQTTDNVLANANAFENLLSLGDLIQVNALAGAAQNKGVRLFNADGSNNNQSNNNGYIVTPVLVTNGVKAEKSKYESAIVSSTNFSDSSFEIAVVATGTTPATADIATVTINGSDTAEQIRTKVEAALAAKGTTADTATVTVENGRVVIKSVTTGTDIVVQNSGVPTLFNNITRKPVTGVKAVRNYTFSANITDIAVGQKVNVNGVDYTAVNGTTAVATEFDASGLLAADLTALATKVTAHDSTVDAATSPSTITLTEKTGKEGTVTFTNIVLK